MDATTEMKSSEAERDEFDYRPIVPGAAIPLRRFATKRTADGSESRMTFGFDAGGGEIDGVPFRLVSALGGSVEVHFVHPGADIDEHAYEVSATDVVKAAFEADKTRSAGMEPTPTTRAALYAAAGSLAEILAAVEIVRERAIDAATAADSGGRTAAVAESLSLIRNAVAELAASTQAAAEGR